MEKLIKRTMVTAIIMAMCSSTLMVSAQIIDLDDPITVTQQNEENIKKQIALYDEKQKSITFEQSDEYQTLLNEEKDLYNFERANLLLEAQNNQTYADTLTRVNYYSSMSFQTETDIQAYITQLEDINKNIKENKDQFETIVKENMDLIDSKDDSAVRDVFKEIQVNQNEQYTNLTKMKSILQNLDEYLTNVENQE